MAAEAAEQTTRTLDRDLKERVVLYSERAFRQAAVEWLVATDQVSYIPGVVLSGLIQMHLHIADTGP